MSGTVTISGLQSKIDIEDTIAKLVAARGYTLTSFEEEQTEVNYDLEAWNEIATLSSDLTDSLDTLREWETWNLMAATSSDETKLTATASSSAVPNVYTILIDNLAQSQSVGGSKASDLVPGGTANTDLVASGILSEGASFTIEGQTVTIGSTETLNTLVGKINTAATSMSAANRVSASILDGRLVVSRENTGSTEINMSDVIGGPLESIGVLNSSGGFVNELVEAMDSSFTVNGIAVTRSSNTGIGDVITGVSLDLEEETTTSAVRLTVNHDTEDTKAAILDYMEKYNALAEKIRYFTQKPLSGETSSGASITALGELYNDSSVAAMERNIRLQATASKYPYLNATNASYTYDGRTGIADSLEDIGIWTAGEDNVLVLSDEDKLDYMLENEFDVTAQLFRGVYDSTEGYVHGLASDFYSYSNSMSQSLTGEIARRIAALEDKLTEISEKITKEQESLDDYQDRLIETFTAMEEAEATFNSELDWFEANFG
ncbi:MAG: flagellar filament capping protein FliD [Kiritimatiellae bacterium]|nr:flagellar filament capping protein FliD [Kiritimatiellia bacterium]